MAPTQLKHRIVVFIIALACKCLAQNPYLAKEATIARRHAEKDSLQKARGIFVRANIGNSSSLGAYNTVIPNINSGLPNPNPPMGGAGVGINYNIVAGIAGPHQTAEYQVMLIHSSNPIDIPTYLYDCTLGSWMGNEFTQVKSHYNRYEFTTAMIGIASTTQNEYVSFDLRFLIGNMYGGIPQMQSYITNEWWYPGHTALMTVSPVTYSAVATDIGLGFKVFAWKQIFITTNIDLLWAWKSQYPTYYMAVTFSSPMKVSNYGPSTITSAEFQYTMPSPYQANLTLGLGYAFPYPKKK